MTIEEKFEIFHIPGHVRQLTSPFVNIMSEDKLDTVITPVFISPVLQFLFSLTWYVLLPFRICLNEAAGPFLPVTPERSRPVLLWIRRLVFMPVLVSFLGLYSIPAIFAFIVRNILHQFRRPFCEIKTVNCNVQAEVPKQSFSVVTSNLCLMPEILSKFNNLNKTAWRAKTIGERVYTDQVHYKDMMEKCLKNCNCVNTYDCTNKGTAVKQLDETHLKVDIITHFPETDFLCLQEVFDRDYMNILIKELRKVYPYIVYDVGYSCPKRNYCGLNSGLTVASKYEIEAVSFKPYTTKCGFCAIVGKGLLMLKVILEKGKHKKVGFIFNTHLQAFQGDKPVVQSQLSEILACTREFRADNAGPDEHVMFDILCGDFNIDNMSPCEQEISKHELFTIYVDVCRQRPGKDHDWTVGTEMRNPKLHDEAVSTPEQLKAVLEDPYLRQHYIIDADLKEATMDSIYNAEIKVDKAGNIVLSPVGGRRRIDVILYKRDCPVAVDNYNFVTRLATLTDHIPVSMTFTCS
ncbi:sphingomyelin phosphodiesterase 5-like isoform X1 [Mya arenaria]|uniref:sphingomyelin phosphodiesterase 5-like isoform X1 n=2 Tax=Mya arenaria TaxID=6604 RepID=UPI0022E32B06|nr:sphingomyelin phosphodiesterase 5-like isoform X1 [Mya arenaria]XP_052816478.1 sphingomyelin phosphodiesterase 5-like isoform X1 [Mya arenaria]XP_052816479.1 sphingomyelin phosphodiesterase 5-like isoform X1 [Mya arenaria]